MKLLSLAARRMSLWAGALLLLTGAYSSFAQTSGSNFNVNITFPSYGQGFIVPGNIEIQALTQDTANDVAYVVFTAMSQSIGLSPSYVVNLGTVSNGVAQSLNIELFTLYWTNPPVGTWNLTAEAVRSNGVEAISLPLTITAQTSPILAVDIASPTNGASFASPTNLVLIAQASDSGGRIADVQFFDGTNNLGVVSNVVVIDPVPGGTGPTGPAYILTWNNPSVGTHVLTAAVLDTNGQSATSLPVTITVQTSPFLSVDIAAPTNGASFAAPTNVQLIAGASDSSGSNAYVQFFDGAKSLGISSNFVVVDPPGSPGLPIGVRAYLLTWTNPAVGTHVLTASVLDASGSSAVSLPVTITVYSNPSPVVRITSPPNNSVFDAPINIALVAYAEDPAAYVSSVQFFAGSNSLGFGWPVPPVAAPLGASGAAVPPVYQTNTFGLIWSNAPPSKYVLTAVATDNAGILATSAPVNIAVLPPPPPPTNQTAVVTIVATDPIAIAGTNCWSWLGLTNAVPAWSNWVSPVAVLRWFTNCGPKDATFAVRRTGATNSDLTVTYSIGGTASNGIDYVALPGVIIVPAGQTEAMITVVPNAEETNNLVETLILSLNKLAASPPGYVLGFPFQAEAIIVDREFPQPVLTGALLGDRSFRLNSAGPDGAWFRVDYSTNSTTWVPVYTNQVVNGSIDFADPDATNSPMRLYRTVPLTNPPQN
jgi:hypothetical protein